MSVYDWQWTVPKGRFIRLLGQSIASYAIKLTANEWNRASGRTGEWAFDVRLTWSRCGRYFMLTWVCYPSITWQAVARLRTSNSIARSVFSRCCPLSINNCHLTGPRGTTTIVKLPGVCNRDAYNVIGQFHPSTTTSCDCIQLSILHR